MGQFQNMEIVQIILSCIICAFEELIESWLTVNQKLFKIQFDRIIYLKKIIIIFANIWGPIYWAFRSRTVSQLFDCKLGKFWYINVYIGVDRNKFYGNFEKFLVLIKLKGHCFFF